MKSDGKTEADITTAQTTNNTNKADLDTKKAALDATGTTTADARADLDTAVKALKSAVEAYNANTANAAKKINADVSGLASDNYFATLDSLSDDTNFANFIGQAAASNNGGQEAFNAVAAAFTKWNGATSQASAN